MKLEMVSGCICDSLTINGKEEIDLTNKEREEALEYILENLKIPPYCFEDFLEWCLEMYGDATFTGNYNDDTWEDAYTLEI